MRHFLACENVGLVIPKINKEDNCFFITNHIMAHKLCSAYDSNSAFPLYLYPEPANSRRYIKPPKERRTLTRKLLIKSPRK
jgi:hypothetical protein